MLQNIQGLPRGQRLVIFILIFGGILLLFSLPFGLMGGLHWLMQFLHNLPECTNSAGWSA